MPFALAKFFLRPMGLFQLVNAGYGALVFYCITSVNVLIISFLNLHINL